MSNLLLNINKCELHKIKQGRESDIHWCLLNARAASQETVTEFHPSTAPTTCVCYIHSLDEEMESQRRSAASLPPHTLWSFQIQF